ncbi:MAG: sugar-binding transcriptional regulator [Gemmatimonadaceae bacterium]
MSKVANLYHLRDQTQQEIADRLHISRPRVSRLLHDAREKGIVQIAVSAPLGLHIDLESVLEERFGLGEVQIAEVEPRHSPETLRRQIGAAAAAYLARTVQRGETIGMAWGTTLNAMVQAMTPQPTEDVRVVQTLGGIGPPDAEAYASDLVRRLALLLGASAILLPAPGIVATPSVRNALRDDPHVQAALRELGTLDAVFVGIGSLRSNPILSDPRSLPPDTPAKLVAAGAVADIALRFFDADGSPVRSPLDDRLLGITTEQLRKAGRVVAVAGGAPKVDAIASALRSKVVDVLITDQITAKALAARSAPRRR